MKTLNNILGSIVLVVASSGATEAQQPQAPPPPQQLQEFVAGGLPINNVPSSNIDLTCAVTNPSSSDESLSIGIFDATPAGFFLEFVTLKPRESIPFTLRASSVGQGASPFSCTVVSTGPVVGNFCASRVTIIALPPICVPLVPVP